MKDQCLEFSIEARQAWALDSRYELVATGRVDGDGLSFGPFTEDAAVCMVVIENNKGEIIPIFEYHTPFVVLADEYFWCPRTMIARES